MSEVKNQFIQKFFLLGAIASAITTQASAQQFVDGGFENVSIATNQWQVQPTGWGWTGQYNVGIANGNGNWGTGAYDGTQYAYVESDGLDFPGKQGWMAQTVNGFTVGQSYTVSFYMAARNGNVGANTTNPITVLLNGTITLLPPTSDPTTAWAHYTTAAFVATSTSNTIEFLSTQTGVDSANLFDDISIQPAPEPKAMIMPLMLVGALGVALLRRRI